MDVSDKAHCLQTPQEKNQANQYKKPMISYMCVQSTAGENTGCWEAKKGTTEDGMVGWHHWLNGHEFE